MTLPDNMATEKNLLDLLERIERNKSAYTALYIEVSKLKPQKRHPAFVKILAKLFDDISASAEGRLYILSNNDFVILGKNISQQVIDNSFNKLKIGLIEDPLLMAHDEKQLIKTYDFPDEFDVFKQKIEDLAVWGNNSSLPSKFPINAAQIDSVIEHLDNINVAEIIKHQSIIRLDGVDKFKLLFQEFFVAVKDLSSKYDKTIDLTANKWLFLYLTQALDKKTILSFMLSSIKTFPDIIGLNLNLSSIFSEEFKNLKNNFLKPKQKLIIEVQMVDVFNNINLYFEAKKELQQDGHIILIDGMTPQMLHMLNILNLSPDMIKIFWDPMMEFDFDDKNFSDFVAKFGADNLILAKCKDAQAIRWGIKYGIRNFQGPYIDALEIATIRKLCPSSNECNATDCLKRKRLIAGEYRNECKHKDILEKLLGN